MLEALIPDVQNQPIDANSLVEIMTQLLHYALHA